jgi:hypothetical protein
MCDIRASSHPHENVGVPGASFLYGISDALHDRVAVSEGRRPRGQ